MDVSGASYGPDESAQSRCPTLIFSSLTLYKTRKPTRLTLDREVENITVS